MGDDSIYSWMEDGIQMSSSTAVEVEKELWLIKNNLKNLMLRNETQHSEVLSLLAKEGVIKLFFWQSMRNNERIEK